jgi:hypothetical protein
MSFRPEVGALSDGVRNLVLRALNKQISPFGRNDSFFPKRKLWNALDVNRVKRVLVVSGIWI